jgi:DNA-binding beta-propeller fold protein YncE
MLAGITASIGIPRVGAQAPLTVVAHIPLPKVSGRIDHLAFDGARHRLFIAALGNNTVEVVDTDRNAHLTSVPGFHEPQGVAVVPGLKAVAIANGDTGTLQCIDAESYQTRWTKPIGGDADNVRFDAAQNQLYVAAEGGLSAVNPTSGDVLQRLAFSGHPESFQLEPNGTRVFANLPGASQVVVGDRTKMAVTARWPTGSCQANYPMALDETANRTFIGCRRPATLIAFDSRSGKPVTSVPTVGDTDDLFYDASRKRLYVIGGEGFVDVIHVEGDALQRMARVPTRGGARTGLWVADTNRLYVAAPARAGQAAEVLVFEAHE